MINILKRIDIQYKKNFKEKSHKSVFLKYLNIKLKDKKLLNLKYYVTYDLQFEKHTNLSNKSQTFV